MIDALIAARERREVLIAHRDSLAERSVKRCASRR
jgi:hypothetical protein